MRNNLIMVILLSVGLQTVFARAIDINRNISYSSIPASGPENLLDVYYSKDKSSVKDVLVFIHGGSWNSGKKETYWWLGRNMARKDIVTIIINYSHNPATTYDKMAADCASALKWVSTNAGSYGGNKERIFVMGHSAGAHLSALIHSDPQYFKKEGIPDPIKGIILNDAFGLDMFEYLSKAETDGNTKSFLNTFSTDQEVWKVASPLYYLQNFDAPVLLFVGEKTYPAIKIQSERLRKELTESNRVTNLRIIPGKKHVPMIAQMIFPANELYNYILDFMREQK